MIGAIWKLARAPKDPFSVFAGWIVVSGCTVPILINGNGRPFFGHSWLGVVALLLMAAPSAYFFWAAWREEVSEAASNAKNGNPQPEQPAE